MYLIEGIGLVESSTFELVREFTTFCITANRFDLCAIKMEHPQTRNPQHLSAKLSRGFDGYEILRYQIMVLRHQH